MSTETDAIAQHATIMQTSAAASAERAMGSKPTVDPRAYDGPDRGWPFTLTPVAGYVGAEIADLDLRTPLSSEHIEAVRDALAHYGVVFFTGQQIEASHHVAFGKAFGELRPPAPYMELRDDFPDVCIISTANGKAYLTDQWHQDVSWPQAPPQYSILHMKAIPPHGGDTLWASLFVSFERLSPTMQQFLLPLTVRHAQPTTPDALYFDHPLVIAHPRTGRRAVYANPVFTQRINELTERESKAILEYLYAHATTPEHTVRWRWQPGHVAMWDNCYVMHYALGDYHPHYRMLERIEVQGSPLLAASRFNS